MPVIAQNTRERIFNMNAAGDGPEKIANKLRLSRSTVRDILAAAGRGSRRTCGKSVVAIEAGDGCGKCVCCRAVDETLARWRRNYQSAFTLEA